ncbi:MAG: hypothetical protein IKL27_06490 [Oscillospiraceae bacterium]|nr:hypothetical protein [Oscillospiraceae bacterium]
MEDNLVMTETEVEDSWDDIDLSDLAEDGEAAEEDAAEEVEEGEGTEETEASQQTDTGVRSEDSFTLKYMGEEKSVTREEIVDLAEKGMNYDKVKGQLEAARNDLKDYEKVRADLSKRNEQLQYLEEIAKDQNMSLDELIENTQVQVMQKRTGKDVEVCRGIVANERRARELQAQQASVTAVKDQNAKRDADIAEFMKAYPELASDPKNVPDEVWEAVNKGESLLNAYRAYEVKALRAELEQQKAAAAEEKRKQENKSRSTGSQKTKGTKTVDPFDAIWYNGD